MSATTKRLRIFAGPNGSGKSTIHPILNKKYDCGVYINADDIKRRITKLGRFLLSDFKIEYNEVFFLKCAKESTLWDDSILSKKQFHTIVSYNSVTKALDVALTTDYKMDKICQFMAEYLREQCLESGVKMSFETVFSHRSKIDFIKKAKKNGYKVYFYFICTSDPAINVHRVKNIRVKQGGHDVEKGKIIKRYYKSLDLIKDVTDLCDHTSFYDNSLEINGDEDSNPKLMFTMHKKTNSSQPYPDINFEYDLRMPDWCKTYVVQPFENSYGINLDLTTVGNDRYF